jgi:hypothetical protein
MEIGDYNGENVTEVTLPYSNMARKSGHKMGVNKEKSLTLEGPRATNYFEPFHMVCFGIKDLPPFR